MLKIPEEVDVERIRREFYFIKNVVTVKNFHLFMITEDKYLCCLNLVVKSSRKSINKIKRQIETLKKSFKIWEIYV